MTGSAMPSVAPVDEDQPVEVVRDGYVVSTDRSRIDVAAVHAFLATSYWSPGIPEEVVRRAIAGAICFGIYRDAEQVGFARVITDRATYAYLSDVFVVEAHRGRGLAKMLMDVIMAHPALQGLRRFSLSTRDAHALYAQYGFRIVADPDRQMEILRRDIYLAPSPPRGQSA
jgi:GNAT superfamily N-acetyltransferase